MCIGRRHVSYSTDDAFFMVSQTCKEFDLGKYLAQRKSDGFKRGTRYARGYINTAPLETIRLF